MTNKFRRETVLRALPQKGLRNRLLKLRSRYAVARGDDDDEPDRAEEVILQDRLTVAASALAFASASDDLFDELRKRTFKVLITCNECGHRQSPSYDKCQQCGAVAAEIDTSLSTLWNSAEKRKKLEALNDERAQARAKGDNVAPTKTKTTWANFGDRWRKCYRSVTHQKLRTVDAYTDKWVDKDAPDDQRGA